MINVRDIAPNTPADGTVDWYPFIQAAINAGIATGVPVFFPIGIYRIDTPPLIAKQNGGGDYLFCSVTLTGEQDGRSHAFVSEIRANFTEGFALGVQGGTGVVIERLLFTGKNKWADQAHEGNIVSDAWWDDSLYLCPEITSTPTAPYAAIAFDPFDAGIGAIASSGCIVRECLFVGWDVAIANGCSGNTSEKNGDLMSFENIGVSQCVTGAAFGHHETRGCSIRNFGANALRRAIDCTGYGRGTGSSPSVFTATINGLKDFASTWSSGGAFVYAGIEVEAAQSVGTFIGGIAIDGIAIIGSQFALELTPEGRPAPVRLFNSANLSMQGVVIAMGETSETMQFVNQGKLTIARSRIGYGTGAAGEQPAFWFAGNLEDVELDRVETPQADAGSGLCELSRNLCIDSMPNANRRAMWPGASIVESVPTGSSYTDGSPRFSRTGHQLIQIGTVDIDFGGDGTGSFVASKVTTLRVGDVLRTQSTIDGVRFMVGTIAAIDSGTNTVSLQGVPRIIADEEATQTHTLYLWRTPRLHWPTTCDVVVGTSGANKLENISSPWGTWHNSWGVGDRVWIEYELNGSLYRPANNHLGVHIVSVDTGANSAILSEALDLLCVNARLFDAEMRALKMTAL